MSWILSQDLVKNTVVPFQDLIDDPEEIKTNINKFEVQNNFLDDESKAVHEKHCKVDGPLEEKSNPTVAGAQAHYISSSYKKKKISICILCLKIKMFLMVIVA